MFDLDDMTADLETGLKLFRGIKARLRELEIDSDAFTPGDLGEHFNPRIFEKMIEAIISTVDVTTEYLIDTFDQEEDQAK